MRLDFDFENIDVKVNLVDLAVGNEIMTERRCLHGIMRFESHMSVEIRILTKK